MHWFDCQNIASQHSNRRIQVTRTGKCGSIRSFPECEGNERRQRSIRSVRWFAALKRLRDEGSQTASTLSYTLTYRWFRIGAEVPPKVEH